MKRKNCFYKWPKITKKNSKGSYFQYDLEMNTLPNQNIKDFTKHILLLLDIIINSTKFQIILIILWRVPQMRRFGRFLIVMHSNWQICASVAYLTGTKIQPSNLIFWSNTIFPLVIYVNESNNLFFDQIN